MNARSLALCTLLLCGCDTPFHLEIGPDPGPRSVHDLFRTQFHCDVKAWPKTKAEVEAACESGGALVFLANHPLVRCPFSDEVVSALAARVRAGTRLLLLGAASRLAHDLGFEPRPPDRIGVYRWGISDATALGSYVFGMRTQGVASAPFVDQLVPEEETLPAAKGETFHFGGGELVAVQCCEWEASDPEQGEVLGRLVRVRDGERKELDAVVLARWHPGLGQVVALGCLPEPWREDPRVGRNARLLLGNSLKALLEGARSSKVTLLADGKPFPREFVLEERVRLSEREFPGAPSLALWGLEVRLDAGSRGRGPMTRVPMSKEQIVQLVLAPAWRAGAGVAQVAPADKELGYPLAWARDDRLARPGAFFGSEHWPQWGARGLLALAAETHSRGMLAELRLDPSPARGGSRVELLTATRFLSRELFDVRRFPAGAFDGFLVRDWLSDPDGVSVDLVRCFQPNALALDAQLRALPLVGFGQVQDAAAGRPFGLEASGISELWRNAFEPDEVHAALLDASTRKERGRLGHGGGSYPDWLAIQAADFARARAGKGARIVWEGCDPLREPDTFRAVLGISLDPLKCALAGRLLASGEGGWRSIQKSFAERVQSGFGAESPLPHDMPFLQNNHIRLCGSGGPLLWDPSGTARFSGGKVLARELSPGLFTTRVRGAKPSTEVAPEGVVDFLNGSPRGPGGYGEEVVVSGAERGASSLPAQLALDDAPRWPRKLQVAFTVAPGEWELELVLRGLEGRGVFEIAREGEVIRLVRYATGEGSVRGVYPLPIARPGERTLSLEIVAGAACAIDSFRIVRKGDLTAETKIKTPAGWRAELEESTNASFLVERKSLATISDLAGFALTIEYERAERGLMVQRTFDLPGYGQLKKRSPRDKPGLLREPFVLGSDDPKLPDLAVVPIELPRYHHFAVEADGKLVLIGYPRAHERVRFGFVLLCDYTAEQVAKMPAMLAEVCEPRVLELDQNGCCDLVSDLPFRWPRVVRVHELAQTPFLVEEGGWSFWRGGQHEPEGGEYVLCYHDPGQHVRIRAAAAVTRGTRPGPGAFGLLALKGLESDQVQVRVLQASEVTGPVGVTMGASFDEARLDGKLWAQVSGQTVLLPPGRTPHLLEVRTSGRAPYPRLSATRAPVLSATWSDSDDMLEIVVGKDERGEVSSWPAWIAGPEPLSIDGAVRVKEEELTYRNAVDANAALSAGVVVRLLPGLARLRYAPTALIKPLTSSPVGH